ncbi:MAG TPA: RNA-binding transcriptional accessory protein, partial [Methylococcaceae bacterium]|nr:RNA-binding transcriptional accessory protein [Methylococcaceae bacterium]
MNIPDAIAEELSVNTKQVTAAINLLDQGATVPFIARYRKEMTQGLDDTQLRQLSERLLYLRNLYDRQQSIIASIKNQGKLTPQLKQRITNCRTKTDLEDLYLPYKPKRQTKAQKAR